MDNEKEIFRPKQGDGPCDGVQLRTDCVRTDFPSGPSEDEVVFKQYDKTQANVSASVELGILSIRDLGTNVMLTVPFDDAVEVVASAFETSKEMKECQKTTSEPASDAADGSDLLE